MSHCNFICSSFSNIQEKYRGSSISITPLEVLNLQPSWRTRKWFPRTIWVKQASSGGDAMMLSSSMARPFTWVATVDLGLIEDRIERKLVLFVFDNSSIQTLCTSRWLLVKLARRWDERAWSHRNSLIGTTPPAPETGLGGFLANTHPVKQVH